MGYGDCSRGLGYLLRRKKYEVFHIVIGPGTRSAEPLGTSARKCMAVPEHRNTYHREVTALYLPRRLRGSFSRSVSLSRSSNYLFPSVLFFFEPLVLPRFAHFVTRDRVT